MADTILSHEAVRQYSKVSAGAPKGYEAPGPRADRRMNAGDGPTLLVLLTAMLSAKEQARHFKSIIRLRRSGSRRSAFLALPERVSGSQRHCVNAELLQAVFSHSQRRRYAQECTGPSFLLRRSEQCLHQWRFGFQNARSRLLGHLQRPSALHERHCELPQAWSSARCA